MVAWLVASRLAALGDAFGDDLPAGEIRTVLRIGDVDTLLTARSVLGHDMQDMLEASVPGLAGVGRRLFLPMRLPPSVWMTGTTDRSWATPVTFDELPADAA